MRSLKKNALLNIIKQICTIVFPLITFPYVVHVLGDEKYGMYTFSSSIVSYITLIAGLGVSNYAVREGSRFRDDRNKIYSFSNEVFTINLISTIVSYILLSLFLFVCHFVWNKMDSYFWIIVVLSISVVFTTIGADWINIIYEDYSYLTIRYIISFIIATLFLFITVRKEDDVVLFAVSTVLGVVFANISNWFYIRKKYGIRLKVVINHNVIVHIIPIFVLFSNSIASLIYLNSDLTILGIIKGDHDSGIYGAASKIYMMVKGMMNAAITVIIPRVSSYIAEKDEKKTNELYNKVLSGVILLTVPASVGLVLLSHDIIMLIAGQRFEEAYLPLSILSLALPFASSACLFVNGVLIPHRKERIAMTLTIISAGFNILLNFVLIPIWGYNAAALTTLLSEIFICVGGVVCTYKTIKIHVKQEMLLSFVSILLIISVCISFRNLISNYIIRIIISVFVSVFLYIMFLVLVKNNVFYDVIVNSKLKRVKK